MNTVLTIYWTAHSWFWYVLFALVAFEGIYCYCSARKPWLALFSKLAAAGTIIFYSNLAGDKFWFLETNSWIMWLIYTTISFTLIGLFFKTAWACAKLITYFGEHTKYALCGLLIGLVWLIAAVLMFRDLTVQHPFSLFILFLTCASMYKAPVPHIYVDGEEITGHGYHGGDRFEGDNGYHYWYDGNNWHQF